MGTGVARPERVSVGGAARTLFVASGFFATSLLAFYLYQFRAHKNDNQTWIVRHGQQPGNEGAPPMNGPYYTAKWTPQEVKPGSVPLPGNEDHRGSVGLLPYVMSFIAGKGINPDPRVPEHPLNKTQPAPQRLNAAGTHFYTKACFIAPCTLTKVNSAIL
ncbi:hypothetical protein BDY19DRAFT_907522 [Irpex rosettiformis]|uniref:Uncharacterized protein n=1 Tax=Irpex rosettiformis TaxID=378272 RepID=A0ACB8TZ37_9APHY|nr:hypothetical protein BDY19DRAFT_907522 [Irpex rosettiformis]